MEKNLRTAVCVALLVLAMVVSALPVANKAMSPETHEKTIASIDEKTVTVLKLTAATSLASAGISVLPGDTATPIAEKLADFTEYFLLTLVVLYAEKYLMTIMGAAAFRILIPIALALVVAGMFWKPQLTRRLALKLGVVALALYLVIPLSIKVSDVIYNTYEDSINNTLTAAQEFTDETNVIAEAGEDKGLIASALDRLSETADTLANKAANILNRFVEALAVMIVTSCIIPILVLVFFLWVIKQITGLDVSPGILRRKGIHIPAAAPGAPGGEES